MTRAQNLPRADVVDETPDDARRRAIVALARQTPGNITKEKLAAVQRAVTDGIIAGPMPAKATLWRWLSADGANSSTSTDVAGSTDAGVAVVVAPQVAPTVNRSVAERRAENRALLDAAEARLLSLMLQLNELKETKHLKACQLMLKRIKAARDHHHFGPWLLEPLEACAYLEREMAADIARAKALAPTAPPRTDAEQVSNGAEARTASLHVVAAEPYADPTSLPVFRALGALPAATVDLTPVHAPSFRERVGTMVNGEVAADASRLTGGLRATLLAPVLSGNMTPDAAATAWRYVLTHGEVDEQNPDTCALLFAARRFTPEERQKYATISKRTLQRWARRVNDERRESEEVALPSAPVAEVLTHRREVVGRPRVATSDVVHAVSELLEQQKNWRASRIATHLKRAHQYNVSVRTVQRIVAEHLTASERTLARGGDAANDVFWHQRFTREAVAPNHCWMMDHTWVHQEVLANGLSEAVEDFPWDIEVRYQDANGTWKTKRGLHVSVVLDAHTRRVLAARAWLETPSTRHTLLALRDAFETFGAPNILYTDNGSDLCAREVKQVLDAAGILNVHSIPYTPQGRGRVERFFRTLKQKILPGVAGYYGGRHTQQWHQDDLLDIRDFQRLLTEGIDQLYNQVTHSATRLAPAAHWERDIGALKNKNILLPTVGPKGNFALLLTRAGVQVTQMGFRHLGARYRLASAHNIPNGSSVVVHFDPDHAEMVHVSVPGARNDLVYAGHAIRVDAANPAPDVIEAARAQAMWQEARDAEQAVRRSLRVEHARQAAALKEGMEIAAVFAEITPPSAITRLLPAKTESPDAHGTAAATDHAEAAPAKDSKAPRELIWDDPDESPDELITDDSDQTPDEPLPPRWPDEPDVAPAARARPQTRPPATPSALRLPWT